MFPRDAIVNVFIRKLFSFCIAVFLRDLFNCTQRMFFLSVFINVTPDDVSNAAL